VLRLKIRYGHGVRIVKEISLLAIKKALVFVFLTAFGCQTENLSAVDQNLAGDFTLKWKQQTQVDGIKLSFDDVADSRCPSNATCIRAGEVVMDLNVNAQQKIQMCLGECQFVQPGRKKGFVTQDSLDVTINSQKYLFILKQVNPYPVMPPAPKENSEVKMQVIRL
jgi:hypothetical protein